ncbi:DUF6095 family protein [Maribacter hydrothermalis]|uniref:Uncharacterized protein n=1 Tax=Maribacter hydrothermalis TaxID=1836467 RepID=A0A1B7Z7T5_9FLAO|nr:DUF6095 family protein [Maribacter hydrothermalis]APQ15833.1 hypothetical protein BTR34_00085 [Maribacter hydrothermalis]OBR38788.1 hypothetical protein A9200_03725 [Maribacter hydrothermalis]
MSRTNKDLLVTGLKHLAFTVFLMFTAPLILWQAFKNQEHFLFWPVCILGIVIAFYAVFMGFKGIQTIVNAVFGKKKK